MLPKILAQQISMFSLVVIRIMFSLPLIDTQESKKKIKLFSFAGLPPDSLTVDSKRLYWVNKAAGLINSIDKKNGLNFVSERIQDIQAILAFGPHLQRLPGEYSRPRHGNLKVFV
jgi:hypothetical protein